MMRTVMVIFGLLLAICLSGLIERSEAQEPLPVIAPGADASSRSAMTQEEAKRQFRTWQAQYRAIQGMMREEEYKWIGYNPLRPTVNVGVMFNVPYDAMVIPHVPVGRSIFYSRGYSSGYW